MPGSNELFLSALDRFSSDEITLYADAVELRDAHIKLIEAVVIFLRNTKEHLESNLPIMARRFETHNEENPFSNNSDALCSFLTREFFWVEDNDASNGQFRSSGWMMSFDFTWGDDLEYASKLKLLSITLIIAMFSLMTSAVVFPALPLVILLEAIIAITLLFTVYYVCAAIYNQLVNMPLAEDVNHLNVMRRNLMVDEKPVTPKQWSALLFPNNKNVDSLEPSATTESLNP